MKKLLIAVLALALCGAMLTGLAEENWYVQQALEQADELRALAGDANYINMMTPTQDVIKLASDFSGIDISHPTSVYSLRIPDEQEINEILTRLSALDESLAVISTLSDQARKALIRRMSGGLASMLAARQSVGWVALSSALSTGRAFIEPEDFQPCVLLIEFAGDFAIMSSFTRTGEGVAAASTQIVPAGTMETVSEPLNMLKSLGVELDIQQIAVD